MRLVPVDFGTPQLAAGDADRGDALEFTPATPTVLSAKPRELTNRPPGRDSLDVGDWPDDFEVHLASSLHRSRRTHRISGDAQRPPLDSEVRRRVGWPLSQHSSRRGSFPFKCYLERDRLPSPRHSVDG